jgi:diguanylate cyclase (GGDEF)-like protein/PAS domain S-box-containing protein
LLVAGLILARHAGILPPPNYTESTFQWFVFTFTFGLTGGLAYFYNQLTDQALERSRMEIRERQRIEMELRKLSLAVEQSPASIVITDLDGKIEYVNPRFTQITGYSFEEAIGKNPRILKSGKTPPETYRQLWDTVTAGKEWRGEFVNHKKDGSLYYESAIISPITDVNGVATHYLAVKEDITERKRAEDALQKANDQLRADMEKIEQLQEELREQAIHDPLTRLYNRRYLNETLARELVRAGRENNPLSVIISDIDHFKMINDTYGHLVGDKFLVEIASLMKKYARGSDIVCRYGGEEFLLVLPGTTLDSATKRAEEIRQKCAEIILQHEGKDLKVTMSFGVAIYPDHGKEAEEIIVKADKALYRAKAQGRNRTVMFE